MGIATNWRQSTCRQGPDHTSLQQVLWPYPTRHGRANMNNRRHCHRYGSTMARLWRTAKLRGGTGNEFDPTGNFSVGISELLAWLRRAAIKTEAPSIVAEAGVSHRG